MRTQITGGQRHGKVLLHLQLEPSLQSPSKARKEVGLCLTGTDWEPQLDAILLAISELVTNAVVHAGTEVGLEVSEQPALLRIEVTDTSQRLPRQRKASDEASSGRGLQILDVLSIEWGVQETAEVKTVWCLIPSLTSAVAS